MSYYKIYTFWTSSSLAKLHSGNNFKPSHFGGKMSILGKKLNNELSVDLRLKKEDSRKWEHKDEDKIRYGQKQKSKSIQDV